MTGGILDGRVAVVTGAGNGLGRAEAMAMAAQGAMVVVNDLGVAIDGTGSSPDPADSVVAEIRAAGGIAVANYDSVAIEDQAANIIQTAVDAYGRVDILVNNAGIIMSRPIEELSADEWDLIVKVHLYGAFYCTRAVTAIMKAQGFGRIICTSSHVGLGAHGRVAYGAAKEGVAGFGRSVARELRDFGVTCNIIRPVSNWRGTQSPTPDPSRPALTPADIAALTVHLASDAAANVNGCIFEVWRGHIGIFTDPPPVAQVIWKDGSWSPDELATVLPQTLTAGQAIDRYPHTQPPWLRSIE